MKYYLLLFAILLCSEAVAQTGTITGVVSDSNQQPIPSVTIGISELNKGATSDASGEFIIMNVPPGTHTVQFSSIGYVTEKRTVVVDEDRVLKLDISLAETSYELQSVEVIGRKLSSYKNNRSFSIAKSELPVRDLPQSVSSVTKELIDDQKAYRLNDVLKNVAGANQFSVYDDITIRGFRNTGGVRLLNGMRYVSNFWASPLLVNIERVEVIKGPSSVVFGNADPGGTINMVTKKPLRENRRGIDFTLGSFNALRITGDFTGPLNEQKTLLYRLNIGYEDADSFRNQVFHNTLAVAPSISFIPNQNTRVNFDLTYYDNETILDRGRPTFRNDEDLLSTPVDLNITQPGDILNPETFAATLSLSHNFTDNIEYNATFSRYREDQVLQEHRTNNTYESDSKIQMAYIDRNVEFVADNVSTFFTVNFQTGAFSHQVLAGFDYSRYDEDWNQLIDGNVGIFDLNNPVNRKRDITSYDLRPIFSPSKTLYETYGGYLQNIISWKNLQLMLSLRRDQFVVPESSDEISGLGREDRQSAWLPRLGITYSLSEKTNLYGTFNQGYQPVSARTNLNQAFGGPFDPLYSRLYEVGLKGEYFQNRLLATFSIYDLTNNNVIVNANDPGNLDLLEQRGQERSTGVEFELAGRVTANLSIQANYAYNHARITESDNEEEVGLDKEQAPRHSSGSWIKYSFSEGRFNGFSISVGHSHLSSRRTFDKFSNGKWLRIPSYTIFNGALNYAVDRFNISFNLNNITDKTYWEGAYGFQRNFVGAPRHYMLSVGYSF